MPRFAQFTPGRIKNVIIEMDDYGYTILIFCQAT